jgi:hypothetical protein
VPRFEGCWTLQGVGEGETGGTSTAIAPNTSPDSAAVLGDAGFPGLTSGVIAQQTGRRQAVLRRDDSPVAEPRTTHDGLWSGKPRGTNSECGPLSGRTQMGQDGAAQAMAALAQTRTWIINLRRLTDW